MPLPKTIRGMQNLLQRACANLLVNQPDIFNQTEATGQTEWNLSQHLAHEIRRQLGPRYVHDIDVTKRFAGNRRPDIIFHTRGIFEDDYLVIELKFEVTEHELNADIRKINRYWFPRPYNYKFGAVINIHRNQLSEVRVILNPEHIILQR